MELPKVIHWLGPNAPDDDPTGFMGNVYQTLRSAGDQSRDGWTLAGVPMSTTLFTIYPYEFQETPPVTLAVLKALWAAHEAAVSNLRTDADWVKRRALLLGVPHEVPCNVTHAAALYAWAVAQQQWDAMHAYLLQHPTNAECPLWPGAAKAVPCTPDLCGKSVCFPDKTGSADSDADAVPSENAWPDNVEGNVQAFQFLVPPDTPRNLGVGYCLSDADLEKVRRLAAESRADCLDEMRVQVRHGIASGTPCPFVRAQPHW